jgi:hypothetical protein
MSNQVSSLARSWGNLGRKEILGLFIEVINIVEPSHPYRKNPYPIHSGQVDYGYKRSTSSLYASCGPKMGLGKFGDEDPDMVIFKADKQYFNDVDPERALAILTHEVTHVTEGRHNQESGGGGHPPAFWREFGFNCHLVLDNWDTIEQSFGELSKQAFIGHVVKEETDKNNIDRRYASVTHRRQEMARWFESTLP